MKKESKVIRKDYDVLDEKYSQPYLHREYYGVFEKNGKIKIDNRRFVKFFKVSECCDFKRNTVYFIPYKKSRKDYCMSYFVDAITKAKETWDDQKTIFDNLIKKFVEEETKKPAPNYDYDFHCGILEYDEWQTSNMMSSIIHQQRINDNINRKVYDLKMLLYSQTINMIASHLEHAMILSMCKKGFHGDKAGRRDIFTFMDGRIKNSEIKIKALPNFETYDKFYSLWNFNKHNSISTYKKVKNNWDQLIVKNEHGEYYDFPNDWMAIEHLNLTDEFFDNLFEPLLDFYFEFCELCYNEPKYYVYWNYDDYFLNIVDGYIKDEKELLENPLGLPEWL